MAAVPQPFRLGEWHAEPALNRIRRGDGEGVHLEPRVLALLAYLAERGGEVVGKEEPLRAVWSGAFVEDVAVARSIAVATARISSRPRPPLVGPDPALAPEQTE